MSQLSLTTKSRAYLNWDILLGILTHLDDEADQSRLVRTCRTLYKAGLPILLGVEHSFLFFPYRPYRLWSFCHFLSSYPELALYVRHLTIEGILIGSEISEVKYTAFVAELEDTLRLCRRLRTLQVEEANDCLSRLPLKSIVNNSLPDLVELRIYSAGAHAIAALQDVTAPIASLTFNFAFVIYGDEVPGIDVSGDPIFALRHLRDSLTRLRIEQPHMILRHPELIYYNIHTLEIETENDRVLVDCSALAVSFPNVRSLTWTINNWTATGVQTCHANNDKAFSQLLTSNGFGPPWTSLVHLVCEIAWAYCQAFPTHVRFWDAGTLYCEVQLAYFHSTLHAIRPEQLKLIIAPAELSVDELSTVFQNDSVTHLHLTLQLQGCAHKSALTLPRLLDLIASNVRLLPLVLFILELKYDDSKWAAMEVCSRLSQPEMAGGETASAHPSLFGMDTHTQRDLAYHESLRSLDVKAYVTTLQRECSLLKHVFITFSGMRQQPDSSWKVVNEDSVTHLERMNVHESTEVMRNSPFAR